jgi:hypothetical protein
VAGAGAPLGVDVQSERLLEGGGERDVAVLGSFALVDADPATVEVDSAVRMLTSSKTRTPV